MELGEIPENVRAHPATELVGRLIGRARAALRYGGDAVTPESTVRPEPAVSSYRRNGTTPANGGGFDPETRANTFLGRKVRLEVRLRTETSAGTTHSGTVVNVNGSGPATPADLTSRTDREIPRRERV